MIKKFLQSTLLIIVLIHLSTYSNNIFALCCGSIPNNDCATNEMCVNPLDAGSPGIHCEPAPKINYCVPVPPGVTPGFSIPRIYDIEELSNFKFSWANNPRSIGSILSTLLPYVFAFSGFLLFAYLIYGAFTILSAMGEAAKIATGSKIITQALIGFSVLFVSYWLMQLLELILGLNIL